MNYYNKILNMREQIPYEIDGVVFKVNDFGFQERLGAVSRAQGGQLHTNSLLKR